MLCSWYLCFIIFLTIKWLGLFRGWQSENLNEFLQEKLLLSVVGHALSPSSWEILSQNYPCPKKKKKKGNDSCRT